METLFRNCGREGLPKSLTVGTMNRRAIYSTSNLQPPFSNLQNPIIVSVLVCLMILLSSITSVFATAGDLKWRFKTGKSIGYSSPAIGSDGTVYIGSLDSSLYAINSDGTVYIGGAGGVGKDYFYAINSGGTLKWSYTTGAEILSSPAIDSDGTVFVGANDSYLYAINSDGTLKWRYKTVTRVQSSPAIGVDGTVYVGSNDGYLYAINSDGTLSWKYKTDGLVSSSPAIGSDGIVYVGSDDGYLYAIDTGTGKGLAKSDWPQDCGPPTQI